MFEPFKGMRVRQVISIVPVFTDQIKCQTFIDPNSLEYNVSKGMSPDRKYVKYLKVGYEEIPDQIEHTPKLAKS